MIGVCNIFKEYCLYFIMLFRYRYKIIELKCRKNGRGIYIYFNILVLSRQQLPIKAREVMFYPLFFNILSSKISRLKITGWNISISIYDVQIRKLLKYNCFKLKRKDLKMQDLLRNEEKTNGRWTKEEHLKFLEGLRIYGKNWKKIEQLVVTRSGSQIRSHAQKFFLKSKSTSFGSFNDLQLGSPEQQEMQETQTVISKSMGESSWKCEDLSYFLTKIIECSTQKNHFDFWNVLVDSCGKVSEIQSYRNRKNSFVGYSDQETVLSNVEKADKALL